MAVGSPALATYSLTLTTLNRYWIRKQIKHVKEQLENADWQCQTQLNILGPLQYLLAEAQQVPLRLSQKNRWLTRLIQSPENKILWDQMKDRLASTRRIVTFSLVAQGSFAAIAWIFVIASAFVASLGSTKAALQISAGSLWVWMVSRVPFECGVLSH